MKFVLFLEFDLSLNTGYAINERESTLALLKHFPEQIRVVTPHPESSTFPDHPSFVFVPSHQRYHPLRYARFMWASWHQLRRIVQRENIDAVVTRPGPLALLPYMLARRRIPLILKTAAAYEMTFPGGRDTRWLQRARCSLNRRLFSTIYDRCLGGDTVSSVYVDWFADTFSRPDGKRLALIPNGANGQLFAPRDRAASRRLLQLERFEWLVGYVGAIGALRHLDLLIDSLTYLQDLPQLGLVLVGDGSARNTLEAHSQRIGVADRVIFLGSRPYEEMPTVINSLDVAVDLTRVPMAIGNQVCHGSFSQKIPQYLACGVPVVAWDTPDTQFVEQSGVGRLVADGQPGEVAAAIRSLLQSKQHVEGCRSNARQQFEQYFSADVTARRRFALWTQLVERQQKPGNSLVSVGMRAA